jgi:hypothetical protein
MQLDLSNNGELSIEDSILIDKIAPEVQNEYNKLVENLISDNALCTLDLLLSVVSRNPHHSSVLLTLCKILLLEKKLKNGDDISLIIIESPMLIPTINSVLDKFNQKIPVRVRNRFPHILLIFFSGIKFIKSIYLIIISWLWPRLTKSYKIQPKESILFIDSFILPGSFTKEGDFVDRYYTGYDINLSNAQRKKIWYSPTLFGLKTLSQCLKMSIQAKKSKYNFIFQESWLTFYDYIYAFYLSVILPFKVKNTPLFMGHNVYKLLISEARTDVLSPSLIMAICKYRFIRNLRKENIEVCHVVNWHENQTIDKALNLAFHKYYPDVVVKGYQGYVSSPYETHKVPQSFELENSTLPNQLHVISKGYKKVALHACQNLDVRVASAFRFLYLYNVNRSKKYEEPLIILISLPMDTSESSNILKSCVKIQSRIEMDVIVLVKHHPAHDRIKFIKRVPLFLDESFIQTNDSMSDLLGSISLLISSASSSCAEAASLGIPVAVHGNRYGITMSPINDHVNGYLNNIFYSKSQLVEFIRLYLGMNYNNSSIDETFFRDNGESARALFACE